MATKLNLRLCKIKHDLKIYYVMLGVSDLDNVDDILQEWAAEVIGSTVVLNLPEELLQNQNITEVTQLPKVDSFVYIPTP